MKVFTVVFFQLNTLSSSDIANAADGSWAAAILKWPVASLADHHT